MRDADEAVQRYILKWKRIQAQGITVGAVTAAAVVGAVPIDFPDAALLTPLETAVISAIAKVYELDEKEDKIKIIMNRILEAGAAGVVAKAAIQQLKLLPGLANIAADIINAMVAGVIVMAIGESCSIIMEKVYLGEIDESQLDVISNIVNGKLGDILQTLSPFLSNTNGKIDISSILKKVFQNTKDRT